MTRPVRLQLSRRKGFNLQAHSLAMNGLTAVSVARPGRWGNPYYPGSGRARGFFDESLTLCRHDVRDPRVQVKWFGELMEQRRRENPAEFESYIAPLRGQNLACWCVLDEPCHADVLLELANADKERDLTAKVDEIIALLSGRRLPFGCERDLQDAIEVLLEDRFGATAFAREKRLSAKDVVDFWLNESNDSAGIAIEVKLHGGKLAIYRQCERYCQHDQVTGIVLATAAPLALPALINGKRAMLVDLGRAWL